MTPRRDWPPAPAARRPLARPLLRVLVVWALEALGLLLAAWVMPDVAVAGAAGALAAVAAIGILNAILYPLLATLLLAVAPPAFGLLALALNAAIIVLVAVADTGFEVGGFWSALALVIVLTLVNAVATAALSIDDEGSFHRGVVRRQARRAAKRAGRTQGTTPGLLFLEIDGLSERVLELALAGGHMPNLAAWLECGSHVVTPWECDLSSQTAASQAGLLHGRNDDIPAFRWYDRATGRTVVSARPEDAELIERRISDGCGLLAADGASRGNMLTGDAPHVAMTISGLHAARRDRADRAIAWRSYLANPYSLPHALLLFCADVAAELRAARRQRRRDVRPRVARGGRYPLLRAATTSFLVDANVDMVIGDVFAGVPCAYATFVAYDEVAHHSGTAAPDALAILRRLDRRFGRIAAATRLAPRPYEVVVLSDHGQSEGATFRQRHDQTLEQLVRELAGAAVTGAAGSAEEPVQQLRLALGEAADDGPRAAAWTARRAQAATDGERDAPRPAGAEGDEAAIHVYASGNLGLIYFADADRRLSLEEIVRRHPALVNGLALHPGVGFVACLDAAGRPLAIGADGRRDLRSGVVAGVDPLAPFGPNAAAHLARELRFANAPDLLVNGAYDPAVGEVAAFEELVGSHGGLGGPQGHPFLLHPVALAAPSRPLVGAADVHRLFKRWLGELERADGAAATVGSPA